MKNFVRFLSFILLTISSFLVYGQSAPMGDHESPIGYYERQWQKLPTETQVSFANSNLHYAADKVPALKSSNYWKTVAWRGETVQTQVLVWSKSKISALHYRISDLTSSAGHKIDATQIQAGFVKYIWTDGYFGNGCGPRNNQLLDSSLVADLIDTVTVTAMKANSVQPVWVTVRVPEATPAGTYTGNITIEANKSFRLPITVQVLPHRLPPPSAWKFELDLWQYPVTIAKAHNIPLWSQEHYRLMKPYYTMLAEAGQKVITTTLIEGGNQAKEVSPAMVKVKRHKDGSWSYDYSLFDSYVSFVMSCGIKARINCYTMVPWSMELSYFDETVQKDTVFKTTVQSTEFKAFWQPFLRDFAAHLKEKKWFEITNIAMDERKLPDMLAVIDLIREVDPHWRIALAGSYHKELVETINDYSVFKTHTFSSSELAYRKANHLISTFYTSCEGEKPNMFTFSSPAESLWMGWYAAAAGFDGYLRWAYNLWNKNPESDTRSVFPAGDSFLIYPGPRRSVRFEKLREGIQDFEKIRILKETAKTPAARSRLQPLLRVMTNLENERLDTESADGLLRQAKTLLNQL